MLGRFLDEEAPDSVSGMWAEERARAIWACRKRLDERISESAKRWSPERMQVVDRSILRVGAFELTEGADVPAAVAIDEAIEIAREFGSKESPGFVNGVLDGLLAGARGESGGDDSDAGKG